MCEKRTRIAISACWDRYEINKVNQEPYRPVGIGTGITSYNKKSPSPRLVEKHPILHKVTMGPKKATKANKGKGKVTGNEPLARRIRSSSIVIREPTDKTTREEPRRSESRKSNARKKKRDEPAIVEEEEYKYVLESEPEEEEASRDFTFPPRKSENPLVRDSKRPPSSRDLYDALMEISFVPSRFPDLGTLRKLGIYDEVREILRHMRIDGTLGMKYRA
ncbi:unnamed protein product [Cochlearia groenlandica]